MLSPEEFKNKLEGIKKGGSSLAITTFNPEGKSYAIPEEYKGHYSGECGECDYDTRMFEECGTLESITYLHYIEDSGIPPVMPEGYMSCFKMFSDYESLTVLDLSYLDTSRVTNMRSMFFKSTSLTALDLSNFDTSVIGDMSHMFSGCESLTALDLSNFDTSAVTGITR